MSKNAQPSFIKIRVGLANDPKHRTRMGEAVWLYLYLHANKDWKTHHLTRKYQTIADDLQMPLRTVQRQMKKLAAMDYVAITRRAWSIEIKILNAVPRTATGGESSTESNAINGISLEKRNSILSGSVDEEPPQVADQSEQDRPRMADHSQREPPLVTQRTATHDISPYKVGLSRFLDLDKNGGEEETPITPTPSRPETEFEKLEHETNRFLKMAQRLHRWERGVPQGKPNQKTVDRVADLVARGWTSTLLAAGYLFFLRDPGVSGWLQGKTARTVAMFVSGNTPDDYGGQASRTLKERDRRRRERTRPPEPEGQTHKKLPTLNGAVEATWRATLEAIEAKILPENFKTWFAPVYPSALVEKCLYLAVPNEFFKKCLAANYQDLIWDKWHEVGGQELTEFRFAVEPKDIKR